MVTEHNRTVEKAKVKFSAVAGKIMISALVLTTLTTGIAPTSASAAEVVVSGIEGTVESKGLEDCLYNVRATITAVKKMINDGSLTTSRLSELATQLEDLNSQILSGSIVTKEVVKLVDEVKTTIKAVKTSEAKSRVEKAIITFEVLAGITTEVEVAVPEVKASKSSKETYPAKFKDVNTKTSNYKYIDFLAKKGVIGGYTDGSFKPGIKMTNGKFISMLVRAINPKSARATKGNDFDVKLMSTAINLGILTKYELSTEEYSKAMTRADMILWTARALDFLGEEDIYLGTNILYLVGDLDKVEALGEKYTEALEQVLEKGILSVDKNKKINPTATVTRSTSAVIIARVANAKYRVDMQKKADRNELPMQQTVVREARTLKWSDRNRPLPQKGDTFIDKNGKKTVLTSIWVDGKEIIGYGQNVQDLYGNMQYGNRGLKHGDLGGEWQSDSRYLGSPYYVDKSTGVGYFQKDWLTIATYEDGLAWKIKNPKNNQRVGWMKYYSDDRVWVFTGPQ